MSDTPDRMADADRLAMEGQPGAEVDQRHLSDLQSTINPQARGAGTWLPLDLVHDPDAREAAKLYAARVVHSRPYLSRDLFQFVGGQLSPGEQFVEVPPELPWERKS